VWPNSPMASTMVEEADRASEIIEQDAQGAIERGAQAIAMTLVVLGACPMNLHGTRPRYEASSLPRGAGQARRFGRPHPSITVRVSGSFERSNARALSDSAASSRPAR
jgi:hypothetical protein